MPLNILSSRKTSRLISLDFFRGITVATMILVNNPGDWGHIYKPLEHAEWNGCTLADLVFPFFLFIMGVSMVYSMVTTKANPENHAQLMRKVLRRAAIIAFLSLFKSVYLIWDLSTLRIPGVLMRIALVYLFSGLLYIKSGYKTHIISIIILLAGYFWLITKVQVPGLGHASLQPETNLGAWLDRTVFGTAHLWSQSKTWDPEGLLGTLPAIATTLIGIVTGTWLKRKESSNLAKVGALLGAGVLLVAAGLLWNQSFPINKALWTSSYVLFTGGLGILCLTLCYWLIDIQGYKWFTKPFVVYGANAIVVYVVSELMARTLNRVNINYQGEETSLSAALYHTFFEPYFSPYHASLGWALGFVLAWMIVLWAMYNRRIFIKI